MELFYTKVGRLGNVLGSQTRHDMEEVKRALSYSQVQVSGSEPRLLGLLPKPPLSCSANLLSVLTSSSCLQKKLGEAGSGRGGGGRGAMGMALQTHCWTLERALQR